MSRQSELAELSRIYDSSALTNRNLIINGGMQVAQRGTSSTGLGASAGYFTCDRWRVIGANTAGRFTMSQAADGPSGFANCLKLDCTTADTSIASNELLTIRQTFEGQDVQNLAKGTSDAKEITFSFYVKANAAFTFGVEIYDADNDRQITKLFTTSTGWARHEITFPADTTGALDDDNAGSLIIQFWLHAGSDYTSGTLNSTSWANVTHTNRAGGIGSFYSSTSNEFLVTGVQLEVGDTATDFEHRTFGDELHRCQRYYFKAVATSSSFWGMGYNVSATALRAVVHYPVEMRIAPTALEQTGTASNYRINGTVVDTCSAVPTFLVASRDAGSVAFTVSSGLTSGQASAMQSNTDGAYLAWSAEL